MAKDGFYFQGQQKLQVWLDRVKSLSGDHQKLYDELGDILLKGVNDRFKQGVAPDGRPWQKSWRAIAQTGQTLRDTGRLLNSIHVKLNKNGVSLSTNVIYARMMHYGGQTRPHVIVPRKGKVLRFKTPTGGWAYAKKINHPGSKIPARPFFGVSEDDAQNMLFAIEEYLEGLLKDGE